MQTAISNTNEYSAKDNKMENNIYISAQYIHSLNLNITQYPGIKHCSHLINENKGSVQVSDLIFHNFQLNYRWLTGAYLVQVLLSQ